MKKYLLFLALAVISISTIGQTLQPYILGSTIKESIKEVAPGLKTALKKNGFKIVGEYSPMGDVDRLAIVVTHEKLLASAEEIGGLAGFAATLRVGVTKEDDMVNITYTNPEYWGNAYYRDDFDKVSDNYAVVSNAFKAAVKPIGNYRGAPFGSEKGLEIKDLRKYHFMFGMPYFDDTKELESFDNHHRAVEIIDGNLEKDKPGVKKVYKVAIPNTKLVLYGIALSGEKGEENFLPKIDLTSPEHTAFLPYELLVNDTEVIMLHGRFRIAISFPDLSMGTFTKIMSTPGDIQDLLKQLTE